MSADLVAIIEQQEAFARGRGELQQERDDALDAYLGRPYGDEQEGRSQVVMRDVADTVEWIKPSLMKVFCSGDEVVTFNPVGPEDEQQAEQETDWCNHVLMQKNEGFLILHDWIHDALLQKNGYVIAQYETEKTPQREQYQGLTDDEFALLVKSDGVDVLQHTERQQVVGVDPATGMPQTTAVHDAVVQTMQEYGCIKVRNIPPERVLVANDWPGVTLQGCPFVEVIEYKTISDLRQEGYVVDDDLSDDGNSTRDDLNSEQRRSVTRELVLRNDIEADKPTRRLRTRYIWMLYDEDGDGIAELRRIVIVGTTILENEEDDLTPVACCTPYRMPHEHIGLSVHDQVEDLQRIRTALVRGFLDNMYLANNGRNAIDAQRVNLDDMLVTRPGGVVRVAGSTVGAIEPLIHPQEGSAILQAVEYVDTVRENRTGVTKYNQGLDSDSLNKTAHGISQIMSASQQRIELVARIIAETGVKSLMRIIHAQSMKHTREAELVKLRNKWVPVDPRSWKTRRDLTISVGLGTGNKDQMLQHLQMILQAQTTMGLPLGLANQNNVYNALAKLTQNAGFKQPEQFWMQPAEGAQMPKPPDPAAIEQAKEQAKTQGAMQLQQMQQQDEAHKFQAQAQMEQAKMQAQAKADEEKRMHEVALKHLELAQQDTQHQREQATQIEVARIKAKSAIDAAELSAMTTLSAQQNAAAQQGAE